MSETSLVLFASHRLPVARMGLSGWVRKMPLFEYADLDIHDGEQALLAILRHQPDIAILDINLPKMNALEVVKILEKNHSKTKTILWGSGTELSLISMIQVQSFGLSVLTFEDDQQDLQDCLSAIHKGKSYISNSFFSSVSSAPSDSNKPSSLQSRFAHVAIQKLTDREKTVMKLISGGKSTVQIADHLCLSHRTIDSYRLKIAKKLNLKGKNTLLLFAHENKDVWQCL
ncbi:LuxR C-terminal-related transcriptional regulator [Roseivirga sp. BDSF3-8]|uniref:response regulator transcription factor n=1 Tax=Roseivirga sp. BDSF3-8 TaxID=3241598 RepID=UPI003532720A